MSTIDNRQIRTIHAQLAKIGRANDKDFKRELVGSYCDWRTDSTKGLYYDEAEALIDDLQKIVNQTRSTEEQECNNKRRKLLHYAHMMNWYKDSPTGSVDMNGNIVNMGQAGGAMPELDIGRVNNWCVKYGQFHKQLNEHTSKELSKLIVQFGRVYDHHVGTV